VSEFFERRPDPIQRGGSRVLHPWISAGPDVSKDLARPPGLGGGSALSGRCILPSRKRRLFIISPITGSRTTSRVLRSAAQAFGHPD
jgi:hypothetical protein